jgi:predicted permease
MSVAAVREWAMRVRAALFGARMDRALDEDISAHLSELADEFRKNGMSDAEAERAARREFGGVARIQEAYRAQSGLPFVDTLIQDLHYAVRMCRRQRGFTAAIVLSLAAGIGLNSALFSTLDALVFRVLPVARPADLYLLKPVGERAVPQFSYPAVQALDAAGGGVAAMSRPARMFSTIDGDTDRRTTTVQLVSGGYFPVLGVRASAGRLLRPDDNVTVGGHPVAVISDAFWRTRFASAADVVGRGISMNRAHFTIVGVAAPGFSGVWLESPVDGWAPLMMQADVGYAQNYYNSNGRPLLPFAPQNEIRWLEVVARTDGGPAALQQALGSVFNRLLAEDAESIRDPNTRKLFLQQTLTFEEFGRGLSNLRGRFGPPLYALLGMAVLILLVACANAANLQLARAEVRRREIAIRLSIGASRGRVTRQLLTESALLVGAAVAMGLLVARWAGNALIRTALATTGPLPFEVTVTPRVLVFTSAAAVATVVIFGLVPACLATRVDLASALRTPAGAHLRVRVQRLLLVAQVALSLVLVVAAGLLVQTVRNYLQIDLGFDREHVMSVFVTPRAGGITSQDELASVYDNLVAAAIAVPGVQSASVTVCALAVNCQATSGMNLIEGYNPRPGERMPVQMNIASPGYFETVGMRLTQGRNIDARDTAASPAVVIVNRALVRRYFQNRDPIGRRLDDGRGPTVIVGVVEDARINRVQDPAPPMAWYPLAQTMQFASVGAVVEVRAAGDPRAVASDVQRALAAVDPRVPIDRVTMLSRQIELNLTQETLVARLAAVFGGLALALVCFGLFSVMSYVVSKRKVEFGIRMALGATSGRIGRAVLYQSLLLTGFGLAAGVPLAIAASRTIGGLLFGVAATNVVTMAAACLAILAAASAAGFVPAARAARVDPMTALRAE